VDGSYARPVTWSGPPVDDDRAHRLVLERTRLLPAGIVPELRLHLADDMDAAWEQVQRELDDGDLPPPFWAFAWLGGQAVARHLLDHPEEVRGRRVLDLATGSGLCALAARRAGAAHVLAADVDPVAVVAARLNAAENGLEVDVVGDDLLDTAPPDVDVVLAGVVEDVAARLNAAENGLEVDVVGDDLLDTAPPDVDVVLAGDVFYDAEMAARVQPWLVDAARSGARVLVGDPGRHYLPRALLAEVAELDVPTTRELEGVTVKRVRVYAVGDPGVPAGAQAG
jgi:predicted nicotinamide N-methyase